MGRPCRINYALGATLVASGLTYEAVAPQVGAKNGNTLRVGLQKWGASADKLRALPIHGERNQSAIVRLAAQATEVMRDNLGDTALNHIKQLAKVPAKPNLKHLQAVGNVLERFVGAASKLEGWDTQDQGHSTNVLFVPVLATPTPQAHIDVESSTPAMVSPGPGVQEPQSITDSLNPQATEASGSLAN